MEKSLQFLQQNGPTTFVPKNRGEPGKSQPPEFPNHPPCYFVVKCSFSDGLVTATGTVDATTLEQLDDRSVVRGEWTVADGVRATSSGTAVGADVAEEDGARDVTLGVLERV